MKKTITTILTISLFCSAMSAQTTRCSYFMTFNWHTFVPGLFEVQFQPSTGTMEVTPLSSAFGGITSVAVYDDLTCGTPPNCVHQFPSPVQSATAPIPEAWWECALDAQPLFIKICWKENPEKVEKE